MAQDFFNLTRQQEIELPAQVNVVFINKNADYQQGEQHSKRNTTKSIEVVTVNLPVVMDDAKAKLIADILMYTAWVERTKCSFSLTRKYAYLEPTDVFTLLRDGATYTFRILKKDEMADGTIKLEVVADQQAVYSPNQQTPTASAVVDTVIVSAALATRMILGNYPLLQIKYDIPTWYIAACGVATAWSGAAVYKSLDSGNTYAKLDSLTLAANMGFATSVLAAGDGSNTIDYSQDVTVVLYYGDLSSTNVEALMSGSNAAMLGQELIQYLNAELIAPLTYRLTGLLRGRRGSEWAQAFHVYGENFVVLNTNGSVKPELTAINDLRSFSKYKGVTYGMTLDSAAPQDFAYMGVDRMPYAPASLLGARDTAGELTISWVRRSRIASTWVSGGYIPLGETTEAYETHVLSNTTMVVSALTTGTTTAFKTSTAHSFVTGDLVYLSNILGIPLLTDKVFPVTVTATDRFTIPFNSTGLGSYSSGGIVRKVLRVISSVVPNCVYSVANQTTDFGSAQASIAVRVFQISADVGRGYSVGGSI